MISPYAEAFFQAFKEQDKLQGLEEQLVVLNELFNENREFLILLDHPTFSLDERQERLQQILEGFDPLLLLLGKILIEDHQIMHAGKITSDLLELFQKEKGVEFVRILSAIPLSETQQKRLKEKLEAALHHQIKAAFEVDPSLVGGIKIVREEDVLDYSIPARLNQIKQILKD